MLISGDSDTRLYTHAPALPPPEPAVSRALPTPVADAYVKGDGSFSGRVAGTAPDPELDYQLALMSNDAYAADNPTTEQELQDAGWARLAPNEAGTALTDAQGSEIPIDPALLSTGRGFDAAIYQNPQGQYVVAYRGTDNWNPVNPGDLDDNTLQSAGFPVDSVQHSDAIALAQRAEQALGDGNVVVTGHSLGGGLASAAALATGATGVTFNAAGLSDRTLETLGFNPNDARATAADSGQLRRYAVNGDLLTGLQQDLPILPVLGSPANAIGHELRINPPAGMARDPVTLHGGGGDGTSYVEALRQNTPYDPTLLPTQPERWGASVNRGLDIAGDVGGNFITESGRAADRFLGDAGKAVGMLPPGTFPWAPVTGPVLEASGTAARFLGDTLGPAVDYGLDGLGDAAEPAIGFTGNVGRDLLENSGELSLNNFGSGLRHAWDFANAAGANVTEAGGEIGEAVTTDFAAGDTLSGSGKVLGSVLDAGFDTLGDGASQAVGYTGDNLQNLSMFGGSTLRSLGDQTGVDLSGMAGVLERGGMTVSDIADQGSQYLDQGMDIAGDSVQAATGFAGDIAQGASRVNQALNPFAW